MKSNTLLLMILIASMLTFFVIYNDLFQLTDAQAESLITFIPDIAFFSVTVYVTKNSRGVLKSGAFIMVGLAVAFFLGTAYTEDIISDTMLQDLTIAQYQTLVIAASVLVGSILYMGKR